MTDTLSSWGGWSPAIRDDPFGHFAEARARCPVQRARLADGHPAWVVLGYDAARRALGDSRLSKDMLAALQDAGDVVAEGLPGPEFSRHMLNVDPPDHTRLRRLVSRAFVPGRIAALEPAIRAIASGLLDELDAAGPGATVDLIEGYAYPLPFGVIGELLGIPAGDRPRLHAWFQVLLTGWAGDPPPEAVEASDGIVAYLRELVEGKRRSPADDLVSVLVHAEVEGSRLEDHQIVTEVLLLLIGGDETTRHTLSGGTRQLLQHPDQHQRLVHDLELLPNAIEEMLRWTAPVKNMARTITADSEFHGTQLHQGEKMILLFESANFDEKVFDDPDAFNIERYPNNHLAFGFGTHFCLGNQLARLELSIMQARLLQRIPDMRLASDAALPLRRANFVSGLEKMPVVFTPSAPLG